jgi:hypothetical protein
MNDGLAARPVTWIEKGVLKNLLRCRNRAPAEGGALSGPNMSLVVEGTSQSINDQDMVKTTKRGCW